MKVEGRRSNFVAMQVDQQNTDSEELSASNEYSGNRWIEIKKDSSDHVNFSTEMATRFTLSRVGDIDLVLTLSTTFQMII